MYALSSNEAEYRGTCSHQHNINCDRCSDLRNAVLDIQVAVSEVQLSYCFLELQNKMLEFVEYMQWKNIPQQFHCVYTPFKTRKTDYFSVAFDYKHVEQTFCATR